MQPRLSARPSMRQRRSWLRLAATTVAAVLLWSASFYFSVRNGLHQWLVYTPMTGARLDDTSETSVQTAKHQGHGELSNEVIPVSKESVFSGTFPVKNLEGRDYKAAVEGLINRLVPQLQRHVVLELISISGKGHDEFEIEVERSGTSEPKIVLRGNNGVALASALHWYLKYVANCHVSWGVNGSGDQLDGLTDPPPLPKEKIRIVSPVQLRYYFNVCTFSYTTWIWNWKRWEREIDFMALSGINLPLAFTGQEYVWHKLWTSFGLYNEELEEHFAGPAFLTWNRMGNLRAWGGPLSAHWMESEKELQRKILARQRSFGMRPVLPCFSGFIPKQLLRLYPNLKVTTPAWLGFEEKYSPPLMLDHTDPMFQKIGTKFIELLVEEYGTDHIYNCDSFNEMQPPSSDLPYLASAGKAVISAIRHGDNAGKWLMQGWAFMGQFWQEKKERVQAYLSDIGDDDLIILDLYSEYHILAWQFDSYYGRPFVWNMLHNFGGTHALYGDLGRIASKPLIDLHKGKTMIGMGITPEAIEQNPVVYDLMLEMGWRNEPVESVSDWLEHYVHRRYGATSEHMLAAWRMLHHGCYSQTRINIAQIQTRPKIHSQAQLPVGHNATAVVEAWKHMLDGLHDIRFFRGTVKYDLVDVTRQALVNLFDDFQLLWASEIHRYTQQKENATIETRSIGQKMLALIKNIDSILITDRNFLLGQRVFYARAKGGTDMEADLFERNVKNQVTIWGPRGEISEYAAKHWAGLVGRYYYARWKSAVEIVTSSISAGHPIDEGQINKEDHEIGLLWYQEINRHGHWPLGNSIERSRRLYEEYVEYPLRDYDVLENISQTGFDLLIEGKQTWTRSPGQLASLCNADDRCKGFTSDGKLKLAVDKTTKSPGSRLYRKRAIREVVY